MLEFASQSLVQVSSCTSELATNFVWRLVTPLSIVSLPNASFVLSLGCMLRHLTVLCFNPPTLPVVVAARTFAFGKFPLLSPNSQAYLGVPL